MDTVRAELNKLSAERAALEADIAARTERLNGLGQPGMHDSLVDKEGFPRADIDVHAVRLDRNAVIRLTNDHKALSQQMEQLLHKLHALARDAGVTSMGGSSGGGGATSANGGGGAGEHEDKKPRLDAAAAAAAPTTPQQPAAAAAAAAAGGGGGAAAVVHLQPFAVVDEVAEGSPAAAAGIQLGDQLCRFGAAVGGGPSSEVLQLVARELQQHENETVQTVFLRAGQQIELALVPRRWEGRGLLGCHLRPL